MDMRDALIEVKEFSNDNNELDESLIGLLRTTAITVNVAKRRQAANKLWAIATYRGKTYTTLVIPNAIWVRRRIPRVEASGAASENHSLDISIRNINVTNIAETLWE